jgi:hypothetical protein
MKIQAIRKLAMLIPLCVALAPVIAMSEEDKPAFSGFLGDYSGFQASDRVNGAWTYAKPGISIDNFDKYNKVILDPVVIYRGPADAFKDIDPAALQQAADNFHAQLASTLGADYPVVTEPGPDVLRLRAALTGSVPKPPEHGLLSYTPVGLLFRAGQAATDSATDKEQIQVDVTMEIEFMDSVSNERLMAGVDSHMAGKESVEKSDPDYNAKTLDAAFHFWAQTIKDRLDEAHGRGANNQFDNE